MATSPTSKVLQHLRSAALHDGAGLSDGQLLECYVSRREEAAFAALVRRHGPMVWGVCRRALANFQDAEDAFQATFMVLVRKAASIVPREKVVGWLYGVARQTTLKARALAARRRARERQVADMPEPAAAEQHLWRDLQPVLDQELGGLPEKYRLPILLCDLGGKTYQEAARQLGCPPGTLSARLTRGRALLAKRLARHGLAVSGAALAAALAQDAAAAGVPAAVTSSTIKAGTLLAAGRAAAGVLSPRVAALTEGVLKMTLLSRLKPKLAGLLALVLLGSGTALVWNAGNAGEPAPRPEPPKKAHRPAEPRAKLNEDLQKLQGVWVAQARPNRPPEDRKWIIQGDQVIILPRFGRSGTKGTIRLDPAKRPKTFDITAMVFDIPKGGFIGRPSPIHGIYKLEGDTLTVAFSTGPRPRPTDFAGGPLQILMGFKREKPDDPEQTRLRLEKKAADLEAQLADVRKQLEDLRQQPKAKDEIKIFRLKNQEADQLAKTLNKLFARDGVTVESLPKTNALIIRASREKIFEIVDLIQMLDVPE